MVILLGIVEQQETFLTWFPHYAQVLNTADAVFRQCGYERLFPFVPYRRGSKIGGA